jgi:hypothetical protein
MKLLQLPLMLITVLALQSFIMANENAPAEGVDHAAQCDKTYEACVSKCDAAGDGSPECYRACDDASEKCYVLAQEKQ